MNKEEYKKIAFNFVNKYCKGFDVIYLRDNTGIFRSAKVFQIYNHAKRWDDLSKKDKAYLAAVKQGLNLGVLDELIK